MSSLLKNLLIFITIIAIGVFGYFLFFKTGDKTIVSTNGNVNVNSQAAFQTRQFRAILNDLNNIDLDSPLLQDDKFLQLKDHNQTIPERSYGRSNPFVANQ